MKAFEQYARDAEAELVTFTDSLESNPSKILLVNAIVAFEALLSRGVIRQSNRESFYTLFKKAKKKYSNEVYFEHWDILRCLSLMRNSVVHSSAENIEFGSIVPCGLKKCLSSQLLVADFRLVLRSELVPLWECIVKFVYILVYSDIEVMLRMENVLFRRDMEEMLGYYSDFLQTTEGAAIVQKLSELGLGTR